MSVDNSADERRGDPRLEISGGQLRGQFRNLAEFLEFFAINVSSGGMCIASDQALPEGSTFHFEIALGKDDEPFEGMARVQWVDRSQLADKGQVQMGVKFVHLVPDSLQLVEIITRTHKREGVKSRFEGS